MTHAGNKAFVLVSNVAVTSQNELTSRKMNEPSTATTTTSNNDKCSSAANRASYEAFVSTTIETTTTGSAAVDAHSPQRASTTMTPQNIFVRMPNTAFGIAMGLAGQAILWEKLERSNNNVFQVHGDSNNPRNNVTLAAFNNLLWFLSLVVAVGVSGCYLIKFMKHPDYINLEWHDANRVHFMNAPHLILIMLALGLPEWLGGGGGEASSSKMALQIVFGTGLMAQIAMTQHIYERWLFDPTSNVSCAQPSFLLSTMGWFLLANLGLMAHVEETWGLAVPQYCLGAGVMFYVTVVLSIVQGLHQNLHLKGSPSLFLLMAPPAVSITALDTLDGDSEIFSNVSSMILGWIIVLLIVLAKIGPSFAREPGVLGEYWAYVFPLSAVATAWVQYATVEDTTAANVMASIFILIALLILLCVILRMVLHTVQCCRGRAQWGDPVLGIASNLEEHRASTMQSSYKYGG